MFKRILKTIAALGAGHGIQTLTQFLLPPAFIAAYGVKGYGEWLVLSAAVGYLSTLDFGLQTYVLNELTALYHRKEMEQFHRVQSVGLWLMLFFVAAGAIIAASAFALPIGDILKISPKRGAVSWTVFCLAFQILASIPMGQILGVYRTFGEAHRGVMWGNLYRIVLLGVTLILVWQKAPFWAIAACQVMTILVVLAAALLVLRWRRPEVCPRLTYWDGALAKKILKPSLFFSLFVVNNFLVYQAPVLMLQRFLGAEVVVAFSVSRMLFSFVRQTTALVQQGIAPEVTRLSGVGDKEGLIRLYVLFESVVLTVVLTVNTGLLLASPLLLKLWLKRPELFDLKLFVAVMLISVVSSVKEYKIYYQYATNHHVRTGLVTFLTYLAMLPLSFEGIRWFGISGFTYVWLAIELLQLALVHHHNLRFFEGREEISLRPVLRLGFLLAVMVVVTFSVGPLLESRNYLLQVLTSILTMLVLTGVSYFSFNIRQIIQAVRSQLIKLKPA